MTVLLYEEFGTGRHRESSLIRHALGNSHDEALVAGLAGGIGFMYFVFEYPERPPIATIVAQAHPEPWVQVALGRLHVPYDATRSTKPRWGRVRAALDEGQPVFCVVDRSSLPWHEAAVPMPGADAYTVVIAGTRATTSSSRTGPRRPTGSTARSSEPPGAPTPRAATSWSYRPDRPRPTRTSTGPSPPRSRT
ncbi:BtrH N-terminal domain-containing protein [Streptomyces cirratus]